MKAILSRLFTTPGERPVAKVYVEPIGERARPEGQAPNPLMLRGLFLS